MITILTPSYNRAHTLPRLYRSLCEQVRHDFEWLIIDDGSSDNTAEIVTALAEQAPFQVRYLAKENGGKHSALNVGFREAAHEWVFMVDSDDWLDSDCIRRLHEELQFMPESYNSLSLLKRYDDGVIVGDSFPEGLATYLDRICRRVPGDKADVLRKSALLGFSFPEFPSENFMAESPVFLWLGRLGKTRFLNYPGYYCEYQEGGLSAMSLKNRYRNIQSTLHVYSRQYEVLCCFSLRARAAINWWRFRLSKHSVPVIRLVPLAYLPLGLFLHLADILKNRGRLP